MTFPIHELIPRSGDPIFHLRTTLTHVERKIAKIEKSALLTLETEDQLQKLLSKREMIQMLLDGNDEPPYSVHHISIEKITRYVRQKQYGLSNSH